VSSKNLPGECLAEIDRYVAFCFDQRAHLEAGDVDRSKYEKLAKTGKPGRF
jgi:hypothetical protein